MSGGVDLNADLGEECGDDAAMLEVVTTANVAAGGHAGGGAILAETVRRAVALSVSVGAHPSYADRSGFGRVSHRHRLTDADLADLVHRQVAAVGAACARQESAMTHVKAHGALYHDVAAHDAVAAAFLEGVRRAQGEVGGGALPVLGMPGSALERACDRSGVPFVREAFADRAYTADGTLVPRHLVGAVVTDPDLVSRQVLSIVLDGKVTTIDGRVVAMSAASVCVHGDTPGAVAIARRVRADLEARGVRLLAVGGIR